MQIQRTIQTLETPKLVIDLPESFVHHRIEVLVITLDEAETKPSRKRRTPPPQFAGRVTELGDVLSCVPAENWGQTNECARHV